MPCVRIAGLRFEDWWAGGKWGCMRSPEAQYGGPGMLPPLANHGTTACGPLSLHSRIYCPLTNRIMAIRGISRSVHGGQRGQRRYAKSYPDARRATQPESPICQYVMYCSPILPPRGPIIWSLATELPPVRYDVDGQRWGALIKGIA